MSLSTSFLLIVFFIAIHFFIFEIYNVLFRISGLTKEKAKFQSISLLTNSGYTTNESEIIMTDKFRRKIAICAMITGYSFAVIIVSLLINVFQSFNLTDLKTSYLLMIISAGSLILVLGIFSIPIIKNLFDKVIEKIAIKIFKRSSKENIITLLDNYGKDAIVEIYLNNIPDLLYNKSLIDSKIKDIYKMNFLMYNRKGKIHDITKDTIFQKGDILLIFGSYQNIKDLFVTNIKDIDKMLETKSHDWQNEIDLIENYGQDAMATITINTVPELFKDKALFETRIKENYKINILMISRDDMPISVNKDTNIKQYDKVTVLGPYMNIKDAFLIKKDVA